MFKDQATEMKKNKAIVLQCFIRVSMARIKVVRRAMRIWKKVFSPSDRDYFWYNQFNGQSQWDVPRHQELFTTADVEAAERLQRILRGFIHRMRARKKAHLMYSRFYDSNINKFYYMENKDQRTFWKASAWLEKQEIPMSPEDQMLFDSVQKIKALEDALKEKDREIVKIRKKTYEELEPVVIADKVKAAKNIERGKDLDEWTIDQMAGWFTELKMEEYCPFLYTNRVDGYLFINLTDADWIDMGITNKFHTRKLQLIMRQYRYRYQKKRAAKRGESDDDSEDDEDELMSEYAPSELSEILNQQGVDDDNDDDGAQKGETAMESFLDDDSGSEEEEIKMTKEERLQKLEDDRNIHMERLASGDEENFPLVGDIVRVRFICTLISGKTVLTTKNGLDRQRGIEFVLGINQIIKGIDRALPRMSLGERSKITIQPEYAYGEEGLFPHIAPGATLVFDLTLLEFRQRLVWVKPLLQEPGLSQRPYMPPAKTLPGGVVNIPL